MSSGQISRHRGREHLVAQVSNLLYRGFLIRTQWLDQGPADWKSAIRQTGSLRYKMSDPQGPS
jgi:hypothetical protein